MEDTPQQKRMLSMPLVYIVGNGDRPYRVEAFNPARSEARLITPQGFRITQPFRWISTTPPVKAKESL